MTQGAARTKLNIGHGVVPQGVQTTFSAIAQLERIALYWLAKANAEELKSAAGDPKFDERRLNYALREAKDALVGIAPYRHPKVSKMPQQLDLTRLDGDELATFRRLFVKAMSSTAAVEHREGEG